MRATTTIHTCRACGSTDIVKNGLNAYGNQQYRCKACGGFKVFEPKQRYSDARKEEILRAYQERASLRGVCRMERWNNTLRQRLGRLARKTLSFSKSFWWHDKSIHWFSISYNLSVIR